MPTQRPYLDVPGTLYYFIAGGLAKLGPYGNILWRCLGLFFLATITFLAIKYYYSPSAPTQAYKKKFNSEALFWIIATSGIVVLRLPILALFAVSADDPFFLVTTATLTQDPRFWVSVNAGSSGPLNIFPLTLIYYFGGSINYATVRLLTLILLRLPSVFFIYRAFVHFFNDKIARILVLPLIVGLALIENPANLTYDSGHVSMLLISAALFAFSTLFFSSRGDYARHCILGLILGSVAYAKLQAAPMALVIAAMHCVVTLAPKGGVTRKHTTTQLYCFAGGCIVPSALLVLYLFFNSAFVAFWQEYGIYNLTYAQQGIHQITLAWWIKAIRFIRLLLDSLNSSFFFIALFTSSAAGFVLASWRSRLTPCHKYLLIFSLLLALASIYGVVKPNNFFICYTTLLFIPTVFLSGIFIGTLLDILTHMPSQEVPRMRNSIVAIFILTTVALPALVNIAGGSKGLRSIHTNGVGYKKDMVAKRIREFAQPNEKMAMWGWNELYYIDAGLLRGTHNTCFQLHYIAESYVLDSMALDIVKNRPLIFLDATGLANGPEANYKPRNRYDIYPALKAVVDKNYTLVDEIKNVRIYVRNDRFNELRNIRGQ